MSRYKKLHGVNAGDILIVKEWGGDWESCVAERMSPSWVTGANGRRYYADRVVATVPDTAAAADLIAKLKAEARLHQDNYVAESGRHARAEKALLEAAGAKRITAI